MKTFKDILNESVNKSLPIDIDAIKNIIKSTNIKGVVATYPRKNYANDKRVEINVKWLGNNEIKIIKNTFKKAGYDIKEEKYSPAVEGFKLVIRKFKPL